MMYSAVFSFASRLAFAAAALSRPVILAEALAGDLAAEVVASGRALAGRALAGLAEFTLGCEEVSALGPPLAEDPGVLSLGLAFSGPAEAGTELRTNPAARSAARNFDIGEDFSGFFIVTRFYLGFLPFQVRLSTGPVRAEWSRESIT
jgi:hypothetical protein